MPFNIPQLRLPDRGPAWKWSVCGLLLLATMVNYMDRLTLNQLSRPILEEFSLTARHYGELESAFGVAFALGAILVGWLVDRWNVRWIYPTAVLVWSLAGFLTGLAQGFVSLLVCRFLLGLAESGNWPCGLRTTQHILPPHERTLGNSILQSGAAVGAVLTPLIVLGLWSATASWRPSFLAIGTLGLAWTAAWLALVQTNDLARSRLTKAPPPVGILSWLIVLYALDLLTHIGAREGGLPPWLPLPVKVLVTLLGTAGVVVWLARVTRGDAQLPRRLFFRRFAALAVVVVCINSTWHFFRAWLPLFLQLQHGYTLEQYSWFSMAYYLSADLGSLSAGFAALALARVGMGVHASRMLVFAACALATTLSLAAAELPAGAALVGVLLVIGLASLGMFPAYYSFSQDLTIENQGKLTGALGCICWMSMSLLHEFVGQTVERIGSYSQGVAVAGLVPLVALAALLTLWGPTSAPAEPHQEGRVSSNGDAEGIQTAAARSPATRTSDQVSTSADALDSVIRRTGQ
jgi:ACS family hexuronate transporter-like MFS transporter